MTSFLSSNGETILKKYFKTTAADTLEGRIIRAFCEDHVQEIDLSHVVAGLRPNTPTLLALLMARGIDPSQVDTLTYTGRGKFLLYPKEKVLLLPQGRIQLGNNIATISKAPPIIKFIGMKTIDIFVSHFPSEIPLTTFKEGFEQRLQINTINVRRETYKAIPNVNTGKIVVRVDSKEAHKVPEFFKISGLLVQTWFVGCTGVRPCSVCGKTGHDKWKCPRQAFIAGGASTSHNADTNPPVQNKQNDQTNQSTYTHSANTTPPKASYANMTKTNHPYVKNLFINLEEESQIEQETCENSGNEMITNSEEEEWKVQKRKNRNIHGRANKQIPIIQENGEHELLSQNQFSPIMDSNNEKDDVTHIPPKEEKNQNISKINYSRKRKQGQENTTLLSDLQISDDSEDESIKEIQTDNKAKLKGKQEKEPQKATQEKNPKTQKTNPEDILKIQEEEIPKLTQPITEETNQNNQNTQIENLNQEEKTEQQKVSNQSNTHKGSRTKILWRTTPLKVFKNKRKATSTASPKTWKRKILNSPTPTRFKLTPQTSKIKKKSE
ncbi:hypothetical protein ACJMK2_018961 [Sinanodonta woodiana]|uniref:CCHC-type domain-containing protein n=1 Tax=Sinanodonta woodiana TaxID=1069815 RepID=A0ABD3UID8_SINWO